MAWSVYQQYRLAQEVQLLRSPFPEFKFYNPTDNTKTYLAGVFQTNIGKVYSVTVNSLQGFPEQCPDAYITAPRPLLGYAGQRTMQSYGTSHEMHTLTSENQWVRICHFRQERWSASHTLVLVLTKVRLWLEAYEGHLATGKPIADFLRTMS